MNEQRLLDLQDRLERIDAVRAILLEDWHTRMANVDRVRESLIEQIRQLEAEPE